MEKMWKPFTETRIGKTYNGVSLTDMTRNLDLNERKASIPSNLNDWMKASISSNCKVKVKDGLNDNEPK